MMNQDPSAATIRPDSSFQEPEIQIILAEYEYQQQRLKSSVETVNQTLTLYITAITFMATIAAGTLVVTTQPANIIALILGSLATVGTVTTLFTFARSYNARIEQTDAERAL